MKISDHAYSELRNLVLNHAQHHLYPQKEADRWVLPNAESILEMWGDFEARGKGSGEEGFYLRLCLSNSVPNALAAAWYHEFIFPTPGLAQSDAVDKALKDIVRDARCVVIPKHWDGDLGGTAGIVEKCYREDGILRAVVSDRRNSRIEGPAADLTVNWTFPKDRETGPAAPSM
jgi:hypothetical protein